VLLTLLVLGSSTRTAPLLPQLPGWGGRTAPVAG
jgi:hypothetical protein